MYERKINSQHFIEHLSYYAGLGLQFVKYNKFDVGKRILTETETLFGTYENKYTATPFALKNKTGILQSENGQTRELIVLHNYMKDIFT